ncbi:MAG: hypothetical protein FGM23_00275 [Alphaproteobacteria bacterium]|nr:hypothetical protein [Alphaproteobacteria bacterium]
MTALRDIQAAFMHDIYTGEQTSAIFLDASASSPARLSIYSNNTALGLADVLANAYPVVKRIVGEEFFKTLARHFLKAHPQPAGNRHMFGGDLATFLKGFVPASALPYLSDIAALEWAYFQSSIADDAENIDFNGLTAAMSADPAFVLALHPSVHVIEQSYNALDIWQEHQKAEPSTIQLTQEERTLVVWRTTDDSVLIRKASPAFASLLDCCQKDISFAEAMTIAGEGVHDMNAFQQEFAEAVILRIFARTKKETYS